MNRLIFNEIFIFRNVVEIIMYIFENFDNLYLTWKFSISKILNFFIGE